MNDKDWLAKVSLAEKLYNAQRMCRDFQAEEVKKFVAWLYQQYGIVMEKTK